MAPKLEKTFTMRGYINKENTLDLKAIKTGPQRIIVPIVSGFVKGSGLDAEILPGGADWILVCRPNPVHLQPPCMISDFNLWMHSSIPPPTLLTLM